ncbi:putative bifunctional diguanylate cyclase/phosphodiesterase [Halioxenophilus sp. WMMB6]|uniref:putative bifunctional diguanylate cyclase/phosphodiesterase n=1 Tax=Halioxenophilus sp. WMMB6 TaxID=3073815 RepID=UPI00295EF566|nr:EAL domain-containing protein [Halioxenophilus sp. WMMB6]
MFVSLKWRGVIFISLVSVGMCVLWIWQTIDKQQYLFQQELQYNYRTQSALLDELFDDNFLQLSQMAQLIASNQPVFNQQAGEDERANVQSLLEQKWLSVNILLELDYIAFFDSQDRELVRMSPSNLSNDEPFVTELYAELEDSRSRNEPRYFVYCQSSCSMVVLEPFINAKGEYNTIAIAQNISDMVRVFYNLSVSSVAILIESDTPAASERERYLKQWGVTAWAGSDFVNIFPVIENFSRSHAITGDARDQLYELDNKYYLIKELAAPDGRFYGRRVHFFSISDKTNSYQQMKSGIYQAALIAILCLILAEVILISIGHRSIKQLLRVVQALLALPKQEFDQAIELVSVDEPFFEDEITVLEKSTLYVAGELKKLQNEVELKSRFLNDQVSALIRSRAFMTRLFDNSNVFILTQDAANYIQSTNRKFDELFEHQPNSFCLLLRDEQELDEFQLNVGNLFDGVAPSFQQELKIVDKHAKELVVAWTHTLVEDESGKEIILSIGMDQTQQKSAENDLRWMANHDGLTGIGNRRSFNAAFSEVLANSRNCALIFIDVNRFKHINDIYGHNVGDQVLVEIADKLRGFVGYSEATICRFAGDEFTVLLREVPTIELPDICQKLATLLNDSINANGDQVVHYSASIGAALYPFHGKDAETLLINADMAMYHAKKKGLGYWHIFDDQDARVEQIKHDHSMILTVRNALEQDLFRLVYQPIVRLSDRGISHYEALIRMNDDSGNAVSPGLFIPLAERLGVIRKIDEWVLDRAVRELSSNLHRFREEHNIAVNISAPTLQANDFPAMVLAVLERYQLKPSRLIIELTETAYIENFQQVLKNLKLITRHGVSVALDDFGVGFSSFTYLKMLPLTYVKLDGSYIKNIAKNADDQVFVKSLSAMINAFGMKTVAEFVEDEAALTIVRALGVTHGQGYFLGMPAPLAELFDSQATDELVAQPQLTDNPG